MVADPSPLFRIGLVAVLEHEPGLAVAAEADDAAGVIAALEDEPDVAVVDVDLADPGG